ncbi:MAG: hypothetical protein HKO90_05945 [Flavobacteriaceae bacterium]|nr:hypothetical protein [Flavobacteriaceae bacterium]
MFGALPHKTRQFFYFVIKVSIVIGAGYFIYDKLINNENLKFDVFWQFLIKNEVFSVKNICFLLFLSIFNWFFEILKWKKLVGFVRKISFSEALKQSLAALTASLITPNRIGDYAVKTAYFPKDLKKKILALNLISHMMQMGATVIFGILGLFFFWKLYGLDLPLFRIARLLLIAIVIILFSVFSVKHKGIRLRGFSLKSLLRFVKSLPLKLSSQTLGLSILRYLIFSFQFYLMLKFFGVDVSYERAMIVITTMYFMSSVIPTFVLTDVLVKGTIALYLFNIVRVNDLTILSIITLMWILNFVFPAILGSFYVLNYRTINRENI